MTTSPVTRFAPSPTGPLHLGHALAALTAARLARDGTFLLRIEDLDRSRCRPHWEAQIVDDLHWLGLDWPEPVLRQSERSGAYGEALDRLWAMGVLYPCTCRRRDIEAAASAPQEGAPLIGPDGIVYPGTCRHRHDRSGSRPPDAALRLDIGRALDLLQLQEIGFAETGPFAGELRTRWNRAALIGGVGDVVICRRDLGSSYHLSVVIDDADQGITLVSRGADLAEATSIHVLLQRLMGLSSPTYHHHGLIRDETGKRLAKRDDARAIATYRAQGRTPAELFALAGITPSAP